MGPFLHGRLLGMSGLCCVVVTPLVVAACGPHNRPQTGAANAPATRTQNPPATRPMGGAKSVTTFFVTSRGIGKGGDLGGLAGADAHCQRLATAAGAGNRTWHAYLSTQPRDGQGAINARDRIGQGP